jgi:hypothetical protein
LCFIVLPLPPDKNPFAVKINLIDIGWDGLDWINLAQDKDQWRALVNTVMNLWVS